MIARRIRVEGKVQGVFYRAWTAEQAIGLGVNGWVRNRHDGSVEVLAIGDEEAVDALIVKLYEGSPPSQVTRVEVTEADVEPVSGFTQRTTG
jgi:acylphosphatase